MQMQQYAKQPSSRCATSLLKRAPLPRMENYGSNIPCNVMNLPPLLHLTRGLTSLLDPRRAIAGTAAGSILDTCKVCVSRRKHTRQGPCMKNMYLKSLPPTNTAILCLHMAASSSSIAIGHKKAGGSR